MHGSLCVRLCLASWRSSDVLGHCVAVLHGVVFDVVTVGYGTTFTEFDDARSHRNDHTTVTAPLPVCSAKLSTVGPG